MTDDCFILFGTMKKHSGGQRPNGFLNTEAGWKIAAYLLQALWGCCSWHVVTVPSPLTCIPVPLFPFLSPLPPPQLWPLSTVNLSTLLKETHFCLEGPPATGCLIHVHPLFLFFLITPWWITSAQILKATSRKHQLPFFCSWTVYVLVYLHVSCRFLPP